MTIVVATQAGIGSTNLSLFRRESSSPPSRQWQREGKAKGYLETTVKRRKRSSHLMVSWCIMI